MVKRNKESRKDKEDKIQDESIENKENNLNQRNTGSDQAESSANNLSADDGSDKRNESDREPDNEKDELKQVEAKLAEMQDRYIRLSAEFDNYRKRTLREKMDISKYAGENLLLGIIPLMDDFDRALAHMDSATDCAAMKNGIDLIYGKFSEFLKQNGIKEIESLDTSFDVERHEAVAKIPVDDNDKKGKVVDVVLKGYWLQDKVLRFSKVVVGE